jgi:DDE superfamily endonuclease
VMPWCDTQAMAEHLKEISLAVDPGCHAVLLLDQAGWHGSARLPVPTNITLLPLPPRSPKLNPVENVWPFMSDNWLSNRISNYPRLWRRRFQCPTVARMVPKTDAPGLRRAVSTTVRTAASP